MLERLYNTSCYSLSVMSDDSGHDPMKSAPLKAYSKSRTPEMWDGEEMWASDDAVDELESALLEVTEAVWSEAARNAFSDDRRTVTEGDIRLAYNQFIHPHNLLNQAATEMETLRWKFLDVASESPMVDQDE
jgi:histone H3/H4